MFVALRELYAPCVERILVLHPLERALEIFRFANAGLDFSLEAIHDYSP